MTRFRRQVAAGAEVRAYAVPISFVLWADRALKETSRPSSVSGVT
jgi:hypothetical protein